MALQTSVAKLSISHQIWIRIPQLVSHVVPAEKGVAPRRRRCASASASGRPVRVVSDSRSDVLDSGQLVRVVALVGEASLSPLKGAPWQQVLIHTVSLHSIFYIISHPLICFVFVLNKILRLHFCRQRG